MTEVEMLEDHILVKGRKLKNDLKALRSPVDIFVQATPFLKNWKANCHKASKKFATTPPLES